VSKWTEQHVWSWLQEQPFASELKQADWRYVNGLRLVGLTRNTLPPGVSGDEVLCVGILATVAGFIKITAGAQRSGLADQFCVLRHALPLLFVLTCIVTFVVQNVASRHFSRRLVRARRVSVLQRKVRPRVGVVLAARWPVLIAVGCSLWVLDRWRRRRSQACFVS
jgi:hypothetical protein